MRPHPIPRARAGYTIAELLITLTILAIVLSLVAPSLRGFLSVNRASGLTGRIAGDVSYGRMEAVRAGRRVDFVIYSGGTRYALVRHRVAGGGVDTMRKVNVAADFPGVTLTPGTLTMMFDSRGLVRSTSDVPITAVAGDVRSGLTVTTVGNIYRDQ